MRDPARDPCTEYTTASPLNNNTYKKRQSLLAFFIGHAKSGYFHLPSFTLSADSR